jgi:hypothetical protein
MTPVGPESEAQAAREFAAEEDLSSLLAFQEGEPLQVSRWGSRSSATLRIASPTPESLPPSVTRQMSPLDHAPPSGHVGAYQGEEGLRARRSEGHGPTPSRSLGECCRCRHDAPDRAVTLGGLAPAGASEDSTHTRRQAEIEPPGSRVADLLGPLATDQEAARASSEAARGPDKTPLQTTSQYRGEGSELVTVDSG